MPKSDDYSKTIIYKIFCKDENIIDIYIGHTVNLVARVRRHKCSCNKETNRYYNLKVYQFIRANGGWDNWSIIEINKCPCLDLKEAKIIEREYIEKFNSTLNMTMPSRKKDELYYLNKDKVKDKRKEYYYINKDKISEQGKEYRNKNKEIISERRRNNRNAIKANEKNKEYYIKHKDIILEKNKEKITCLCGLILSYSSLSRHKKSIQHMQFMEQLNTVVSS